MTPSELENYILGKANATKTLIAEWNYIRYTTYSLMFASLAKTDSGAILTVWGRFEQYEKDYHGIIVPALDNEPRHFTSVILPNNKVPDHVLKSMIDYSYRARKSTVIMPSNADGKNSDMPYIGINLLSPEPIDENLIYAQKEVSATEFPHAYYGIKKLLQDEELPKIEGDTPLSVVPYEKINDDNALESMKKLLKAGKLLKNMKNY